MRRTLAALCFVLACVLPAVALGTWWAYGLATDTDRFTEVARPLASDDAVQAQVVDELVAVGGSRLANAGVPDPAAARRQIRAVAETLVETAAYRRAWLAVQRTAHARLAARLSGDVTAPLTLDLAPIAEALRVRVRRSAALASVADAIVDPDPVVVLDRDEVQRARDATNTVRIVRGIAIPGAVLALLGVLLTASGLARGLVRAGLAVGVATLLVVAGDALARSSISASGKTGQLRLAVYDVVTDGVRNWVIGGVIAAVALVAVGAAVSALDPGRPAERAPRA
ncbi:hypothetical protein DSM104299_05036 [Baekduia alba]|uniref:hypothetical protein n=1 Tax=Baekduia alba TaxID=2997333 RepID=UPI0023414192|nr:hypothetical protein [Baekduia alba]WCB96279.1 hypothetical protein DSM104299_05036 [Baekduia alba]